MNQTIFKEPFMPYFEGLHPLSTEKRYVETTIPQPDETEIVSHHVLEYTWQRTQLFYCKRKKCNLKHEFSLVRKTDRRGWKPASWFS